METINGARKELLSLRDRLRETEEQRPGTLAAIANTTQQDQVEILSGAISAKYAKGLHIVDDDEWWNIQCNAAGETLRQPVTLIGDAPAASLGGHCPIIGCAACRGQR